MSSLTDKISMLQKENKRLKNMSKSVDKFLKSEFGLTADEIHNTTKMANQNTQSDFESTLFKYYGIKYDHEKIMFLKAFCTENSKRYYEKRIQEIKSMLKGQ